MVECKYATGSIDESQWLYKQRRFEDDEKGNDERLELFRNAVKIRVVEGFLGLMAKSGDSAEDVEGSIIWLDPVNASMATVGRCLTKRKIRGGQWQK